MQLPKIPNQKSKVGFYFHIPFCPHICPYCDFVKTSQFSKKSVDVYFQELYCSLDLLLKDFLNVDFMRDLTHCTVYFGGGTPSLFPAKFYEPILKRLSQYFTLEEVTLESNPFTNNRHFFSDYRAIGIDRITLGAQSLCSDTLKALERKHTKKDILDNIQFLKKCLFNQIQVDLMYGLAVPRTIPIDREINTMIDAGATGISAYGLTIEPRTSFGQSTEIMTNEEIAIFEYETILKTCSSLGLRQIETSNFSFFDAKHNNIYWYGYPYFGIGTGAHGLLPPLSISDDESCFKNIGLTKCSMPYGIRYHMGETSQEIKPGDNLIKFDSQKDITKNFQFIFESTRTRTNMIEELIFTLLRTEYGIPINWLISMTDNPNICEKMMSDPKIKRGFNEEKIILTSTHMSLSAHEKIRGNRWALDFICAIL